MIQKDSGYVEILDVHMDISHLEEVVWNVGKKKEVKITQSVTLVIKMAKLKSEDLDFLTEIRGVDAWIIRVISSKGSELQDLGSLYTNFRSSRKSRVESGSAAKTVSVKLYYAAAYASERLRNSRCPSFNHDKKLHQWK